MKISDLIKLFLIVGGLKLLSPTIYRIRTREITRRVEKRVVERKEVKPPTPAAPTPSTAFVTKVEKVERIAPHVKVIEEIAYPYPSIDNVVLVPPIVKQPSPTKNGTFRVKVMITNIAPKEFTGTLVILLNGKEVWRTSVSIPPNLDAYVTKWVESPTLQAPNVCVKQNNGYLCTEKTFRLTAKLLFKNRVVSEKSVVLDVEPPTP